MSRMVQSVGTKYFIAAHSPENTAVVLLDDKLLVLQDNRLFFLWVKFPSLLPCQPSQSLLPPSQGKQPTRRLRSRPHSENRIDRPLKNPACRSWSEGVMNQERKHIRHVELFFSFYSFVLLSLLLYCRYPTVKWREKETKIDHNYFDLFHKKHKTHVFSSLGSERKQNIFPFQSKYSLLFWLNTDTWWRCCSLPLPPLWRKKRKDSSCVFSILEGNLRFVFLSYGSLRGHAPSPPPQYYLKVLIEVYVKKKCTFRHVSLGLVERLEASAEIWT